MISKVFDTLLNGLSVISSKVVGFGSTALMLIMLLIVIDVILRRIFNSPLPFSYELTELMLVVVFSSFLLYSTATGRHVGIDVLISRFPAKVKKNIITVVDFLSVIFLGLIGWRSMILGLKVLDLGTTSGILHIPQFAFLLFLGFCTTLASLVLLVKVLNSLFVKVKK
jgi:TRAP-type C4-dicarboxylate transport system permease small subunit